MNVTKIRYKEIMGKCINSGTLRIEHDFIRETDLVQYLRENWFNVEDAERIKSVEIDPDTEGEFNLTLTVLDD